MITPEYLAGFFDGEGTFYLGKQIKNGKEYPHATVMLSQSGDSGLRLFEQIQKSYGGNIYQHLKPGQHKATKAAYKMYWNKEDAITLIMAISDFLILKQKEALDVLTYLTRK